MIRRQVVIPAPPERVWEFLTDPRAAGPWLGGHLDWSPAAGGRISFEGDDGSVREGVVQEVRLNRFIRYRWWPARGQDGPPSEVAYLLEPAAGDTRLTVMERVVEGEVPPPPPAVGRPTTGPTHRTPPPSPQAPAVTSLPEDLARPPLPGSLSSAGRWDAGDELMLSSWARTESLCQIG